MNKPTEQDIEQLKNIRDNAPDGATHTDVAMYYKYKNHNWFDWIDGWGNANDAVLYSVCNMQSLSDIKTIIKKYEENEKLTARVEELIEALEEMTPCLPPINAPCHYGITTQEKCRHCSRIMKAKSALDKGGDV